MTPDPRIKPQFLLGRLIAPMDEPLQGVSLKEFLTNAALEDRDASAHGVSSETGFAIDVTNIVVVGGIAVNIRQRKGESAADGEASQPLIDLPFDLVNGRRSLIEETQLGLVPQPAGNDVHVVDGGGPRQPHSRQQPQRGLGKLLAIRRAAGERISLRSFGALGEEKRQREIIANDPIVDEGFHQSLDVPHHERADPAQDHSTLCRCSRHGK